MKRVAALVVLAIVVAALVGGSSHGGKGSPARAASKPAPKPSPNKSCGQTLANTHTSCPFAEAVYAAYFSALHAQHSAPERINARSSTTHRWYTLSCGVQNAVVRCSEGDALVSFSYPEESHGEEEDQVGSASHAGDAKFCEERQCIGSFTTEEGTVVECEDGSYSHAGGISGACSDHGGVREG